MVQVAVGVSVAQFVVRVKLGVVTVGAAIWKVAVPVFLRVTVCSVAVAPGTLLKVSALGVSERPGSGAPKPVSEAVSVLALVGSVRVPVIWPVVVGAKATSTKQEAVGARVPVQGAPPEGAVLITKPALVVGAVRETAAEVRLVRVKSVGALVESMGMAPKSWLTGVRMSPVSGRPLPVSARM